jgi:hypothetical protein
MLCHDRLARLVFEDNQDHVMNNDFPTWLAQNPAPDLQELVRKHGGYSSIPAEAWAEYDRAVEAWQRRRRDRYGGAITHAPDLRRAGTRRARR